jgi:N-hydroxyarylamine O-acetyltransferase
LTRQSLAVHDGAMLADAYLERIRYAGPLVPSAETLRALHQAHMLTVPFENLDIHLGRPIVLELPRLYDKIVNQRRGGFCYELNGLFAWLLGELGFRVEMLSARVCNGGEPGPEFDHMALLVQLDERLLADVGFGDSFIEPLQLDDAGEQIQRGVAYRIESDGEIERMLERQPGQAWSAVYQFTLQPRQLSEYAEMCVWQQTAPESHFTQKRVCSLATPDGRVTLSNMKLIVTKNGERQERSLADDDEYRAALSEYFGIA